MPICPADYSCSSTSDHYFTKQSVLDVQSKAISHVGVKIWNGIPTTVGDKSVKTLRSKIRFSSLLDTLSLLPPPPPPPDSVEFFYFFDWSDHSTYTTLNWGARGTRGLTLDANKIEQVLRYRKASFPKSVCKLWWFPLYIEALAS